MYTSNLDSKRIAAVFVLKAAARKAKARDQRLYACAIDASKAFDKVSRSKLWLKLIEKQIAPELIISIYKYYENSLMLIQIDDEFSELFLTGNCVSQGGAISSRLFSIYVEKIDRVEECQLGFKIERTRIDILKYADGVIILAKTKSDLQTQIDKIGEYGVDHGIKFNLAKCELIVFNNSYKRTKAMTIGHEWQCKIILNNGKIINQVSTIKYLGIIISDDYSHNCHFSKRKQAAFSRIQ